MAVHRVSNISNTAFVNKKATITSVDLCNVPFNNNDMSSMFNGCNKLTEVKNINENVTNMYSTFSSCSGLLEVPTIPNNVIDLRAAFWACGLVNAPIIPNSVTDLDSTFSNCYNLVNAPIIPNSIVSMVYTFQLCTALENAPNIPNSVTNMYSTFGNCYSLTGNIYIMSNQITNARNCFITFQTWKDKDVYIPFKYVNGVQSATYNSFITAGYSTSTRVLGVLLKDITPLLPSKDYQYTVQGDGTAVLTKYIGTSTKVVGPSKVEGDL